MPDVTWEEFQKADANKLAKLLSRLGITLPSTNHIIAVRKTDSEINIYLVGPFRVDFEQRSEKDIRAFIVCPIEFYPPL
ncbi:MAG: hypothetical protein QW420_06165 [Candidatus Caldarchaeum sp.]